MSAQHYLQEITEAVKKRFEADRTVLSFDEYLDLLHEDPRHFCRNAAQYLHDAFLYFGTTEIKTPFESKTHYHLFDQEFNEEHWVIGQETAQEEIMTMLKNFIEEGRINKLIVLHGPNGSGKSSITRAIAKALEDYSYTQEGAIYRFNWIFPAEKKLKSKGIGFAQNEEKKHDLDSYAHLEGDQIDARLPCPLKDHPLLLIPLEERRRFFEKLYETGKLPASFRLSQYLQKGDLSPRNKKIFNSLLLQYGGDYSEVLRHVQVERYYISRRYRESVTSIEPQMHVDASIRQVTADHSLAALPKPLANLNLFEPRGALVDANRGFIEYSDLLKRPFEAYKYLLTTCETGQITIDSVILFLDLVMMASINDQNLDQFRERMEFISFKSRIELIKVPYLLRYSVEQEIYDRQLKKSNLGKPITPHVTMLASLWAVLTRLRHPNAARLPEDVAELVAGFSPLEKANYYNDATIPSRFSAEERKKLLKAIKAVYEETKNDLLYEGRFGVSPREIRLLLLNAAQNKNYTTLSPLALFEELEAFVEEENIYPLFEVEPRDGYLDPKRFISIIKEVHRDLIQREFHLATGLIKPNQYKELLERYIQHVKAFVQKEKIRNPVTGASEDPDEQLMNSIESILLSSDEDANEFRQNLIGKIGAYKIEHPEAELDIPYLFGDFIQILERDFFQKNKKKLRRIAENSLAYLIGEKAHLKDNELKAVQETIETLEKEYGYPYESIREMLALVLRAYDEETPLEKEESSEE